MSPPKKDSSDFESRFFDLLEGTIKGIDGKVDKLSDQVEKNGKRLGKLERKVFPDVVPNIQQLPSWYRDPNIIKLLTLVVGFAIVVAAIIAGLKGIKIPGVF